MNYLQARQVKDGSRKGKWHFTVRNDDHIWPVGYCRHDCPGHDTSEGAERHYYEYEIDTAVFRRFTLPENIKEKCEFPDCLNFTRMVAQVGGYGHKQVILCNRHQNKAGLRGVLSFSSGLQIISS